MSKIISLWAMCLLGSFALHAQQSYFQQEVNYTIRVTLDDRAHTLTGDIAFEYINHSPDALSEIWVHLWPNAFKNRRSAYCKQALRQGEDKFYFAQDSSLGRVKLLDFMANGQKVSWEYDRKNPDIARIVLAQPLIAGGKVTISTPFQVKVPASFSRLGHVGTSYQITQWYPKPAVYDREGWHAMPYLNQGEFYSEFGSFDVQITLPENYVVGATGTLMTASEHRFLEKKEAETKDFLANLAPETTIKKKRIKKTAQEDPFPASSATMKTIRYTAQNVHDFAWFADKRFFVLKDTASLASGKKVDCWAMFTKSDFKHWKKGAFYVKRAVEFYSQHVGEYPYPQATAVHSALSAGGGMEYPMITVIGNSADDKSLDEVITHEVGHNWFYGILASDERDHPWMDEGMNSYYEQRYMRTYYGGGTADASLPKKLYNPKEYGGILENGILMLARNGEDTPGDLNSDKMTNAAYGLQVYMKTAHCLRWLEEASGTAQYDAAMKDYFQKWKFKHPQPEDFSQTMRQNGINPDWFMEQMQTMRHADPALVRVKNTGADRWRITVRQRGQATTAPFSISAMKDGEVLSTEWFSPEKGQKQFDMKAEGADAFVLNRDHRALDYRHINNNIRTDGLFKKADPIKFKLLAPVQHPSRRTIGVLPWLGWNQYDQLMAGLLFYNPILPGQRIQYYLAPSYATQSGGLAGIGDIRFRWHPQGGPVKRVTIGVNGRTFHDAERTYNEKPHYVRYYRISPMIKADFRSANTALRQSVQFRWNHIGQGDGLDTSGIKRPDVKSNIWETKYQLSNLGKPNPFDLSLMLEGQQWDAGEVAHEYLRMGLEWKQQFYFASKRKISARVYGGYFLKNTYRERKTIGFGATDGFARGTLSLAQNGYTDYKYDYLYYGRNATSGFNARQIYMGEGGFKYAFGPSYSSTGDVGHSNHFLAALNLEADLPRKLPLGLPLKPYFDLGYADLGFLPAGGDAPEQLFWSGGFNLSFFKGFFNVYLPVVNSKNINRLYQETSKGNYLRRITWSVRLNGLDPHEQGLRMLK